jgi:ketosteroid isomerase-like protein
MESGDGPTKRQVLEFHPDGNGKVRQVDAKPLRLKIGAKGGAFFSHDAIGANTFRITTARCRVRPGTEEIGMATKPEIMSAYLGRITAGDLQGAAEYYTDDSAFPWAGQGPLSSDYTDRAAVLDMLADHASRAQASVETHDTVYSDDHAVALVRVTLTRDDRPVATNRVVVYHFADDKISEVWVVDADQQAVDELLA